MDEDLLAVIKTEFKEEEIDIVIKELESINLDHVMAKSEYNLRNTRFAIITLAEGKLEDVKHYTERAKIDFRDVIMWACQKG